MSCIFSATYLMYADIMRMEGDPELTDAGQWQYTQSESGNLTRVWVTDIDPNTGGFQLETFECLAESLDSGTSARTAAIAEEWGTRYVEEDFIKVTYSPSVLLTKRDKITNVRMKSGEVLWNNAQGQGVLTFDVIGIVPIIAPFAGHAQNYAILRRSEVQYG